MGQDTTTKVFFSWSQAKPVPDADGFAGSYAGTSNGALIVAGGANFPGDKRPWTQGVKTWYDKVFVLEKPDGEWKEVGRLPRPMGYGVSLSYKDGLVCLGGGDAKCNYADAFILKYTAGKVETVSLPSMPGPVINACGVISGRYSLCRRGHRYAGRSYRKQFLEPGSFGFGKEVECPPIFSWSVENVGGGGCPGKYRLPVRRRTFGERHRTPPGIFKRRLGI